MKIVIIAIIGILAIILIAQLIQFRLRVSSGKELSRSSIPYQQIPTNPKLNILVIGDSSGLGTGASNPSTSVAGQLGAKFPNAQIINIAQNGARTGEIKKQIQQFKENTPLEFDLIIIHSGGNDAVRFIDLDVSARNISDTINIAHQLSDNVVVFTFGNLGDAPIWPIQLKPLYYWQSARANKKISDTVAEAGATHIPLHKDDYSDDMPLGIPNYFHKDGFHPNDAGYANWYRVLEETLKKEGIWDDLQKREQES